MEKANNKTQEKSLRDIINELGDHDYSEIIVRCAWAVATGEIYDTLSGFCSYINGELKPLDGDAYSLDDMYERWEETIDNTQRILTVWCRGVSYEE